MQHQIRRSFFALILLLLFLSACSTKSDRERIIGLWQVLEINFMGRPISDGKEWFRFNENGTVRSRSGQSEYQQGWWSVAHERQTFYIREGITDSLAYDYQFRGDTFVIKAMIALHNPLIISMVPTSKVLIDREEELGDNWPEL